MEGTREGWRQDSAPHVHNTLKVRVQRATQNATNLGARPAGVAPEDFHARCTTTARRLLPRYVAHGSQLPAQPAPLRQGRHSHCIDEKYVSRVQ